MKYRQIVISLAIGLMLGMSTNAFAAIGDTVSAVFASFNYVVNGTDKTVSSPVLVYEGTSYVRTTDIGNMLGFDVTYKADSRTISFSGGPTPNPTLAPSPTPTTVTGGTYGPTPSTTPASIGAPDLNATPSPTPNPSATPVPSGTPAPSATPSPSPEPTPTPRSDYNNRPDIIAACQANRTDIQFQIDHQCQ